jgi:hypothetical protein
VSTTERILPLEIQIVSIAVLLAFCAWVVWLIRSQRLQLRESLIWLLTTLGAIAITAWPELLASLARALGVRVPANALFGAGLLYLALNVLSVTIAVSGNTVKVRRLAQECALLRSELAELRARAAAPPPPPPAPPDERRG